MADINNIENKDQLLEVIAEYLTTPRSPKLTGAELGIIVNKTIEFGGSMAKDIKWEDMVNLGAEFRTTYEASDLVGLNPVLMIDGISLFIDEHYIPLLTGGFILKPDYEMYPGQIARILNFQKLTNPLLGKFKILNNSDQVITYSDNGGSNVSLTPGQSFEKGTTAGQSLKVNYFGETLVLQKNNEDRTLDGVATFYNIGENTFTAMVINKSYLLEIVPAGHTYSFTLASE